MSVSACILALSHLRLHNGNQPVLLRNLCVAGQPVGILQDRLAGRPFAFRDLQHCTPPAPRNNVGPSREAPGSRSGPCKRHKKSRRRSKEGGLANGCTTMQRRSARGSRHRLPGPRERSAEGLRLCITDSVHSLGETSALLVIRFTALHQHRKAKYVSQCRNLGPRLSSPPAAAAGLPLHAPAAAASHSNRPHSQPCSYWASRE